MSRGNPHINILDNDGPNFSDDWFGWTMNKLDKFGSFTEDAADSVSKYVFGTANHIDKAATLFETIDKAAELSGNDPIFGESKTKDLRERIGKYEGKAQELQKRYEAIHKVLKARQEYLTKGAEFDDTNEGYTPNPRATIRKGGRDGKINSISPYRILQ